MFNPLPKPEPKNKSKDQKKCVKCGSKQVVNKTHSLCYEHNQERLRGSSWKQDKIRASNQLLAKKVSNYSKLNKSPKKSIKQVSQTNSFTCSDGTKITKQLIETRVKQAKKMVLQVQFDEYGYNFCEECKINASNMIPLDCSHTISVDECQKSRRAELAFDESNIRILCRNCHQKHDKLA
jgi:hypothetical protein